MQPRFSLLISLYFFSHRPENITGLNTLSGTMVPPALLFRLPAWDHGPACIIGQIISLGPRSHLQRRSDYQSGTTVPPATSVRLSVWEHGPTCSVGQIISLGTRSHLQRRSDYQSGTTVSPVSSGTLSVWDRGSINVCHEYVLAC